MGNFEGGYHEDGGGFYTSGFLHKGCNASFISLIPKKEEAILIKDFKPISLISNTYKIISKILPHRMKVVLESMISHN